jgi:hypothetical protein
MYSQLIYRERFSIRIAIILFFVGLLEKFDKNLEKGLVKMLVKSFNRLTRIQKILIAKQDTISKKFALRWLRSIREPLSMIDKYELTVSKANNSELSESFKSYKKSLFRFEAILHKIATADNSIIETPDYLKKGLSKMGLTSTLSHSDQ